MSKLRLWWLYLATFFKRHQNKLLPLLAILSVLLISLYLFRGSLFKPVIRQGLVGTFTQRDIPELVTDLLSAGLVKVDSSGVPHPNLITGWDVNNDATLYTVKLKNDLYWIDKTKIKASDISFNLPDVEVKVLDDSTIQFKLVDSFSPFPTLLTKPIFKKNTLIGTGAYKLKSIQKDQIFIKKIILTASNKNLPDIQIRFYPNERIARNALKLGEVQSWLGVSEIADLGTQRNLALFKKSNFGQVVTIFYNTQDKILSDENFRLALSYASPSIDGEIEAKTSLPNSSWAFNSEVKDFLNNPTQTQVALKKVQKKDQITLTATSSLKNVGEKVVQAWNQAGIKSVLRVENGIPQNFQALLITQNIPLDPDQYSLWHSTQTKTNISKISNPRIDKDLEDGRKTSNLETRKERYKDFQKVLLDNAPATFLYFPKYNVVYMKKIEKDLKKVLELQLPN